MIILRVAMGRGWRKETLNELNTALIFANPAPVHEQGRAVPKTIHNAEDPVSRESSDMSESLRKPMSGFGVQVVSIV
jgi:hypothetical protein